MTAFQVTLSSNFLRISGLLFRMLGLLLRDACCRTVSTERGVGSRWYVSGIARTHGRGRARQLGQWGGR